MRTTILIALLLVKCTGTTLDGTPESTPEPPVHAPVPTTLAGCAEDELECMDPTNTVLVCIDPRTNPENCGACGTTCVNGPCLAGSCMVQCLCMSPCGDTTIYLGEWEPYADAAGRCMDVLDCDEHCECECGP